MRPEYLIEVRVVDKQEVRVMERSTLIRLASTRVSVISLLNFHDYQDSRWLVGRTTRQIRIRIMQSKLGSTVQLLVSRRQPYDRR